MRARYVLASVMVFGLGLGFYLLRATEQDKFVTKDVRDGTPAEADTAQSNKVEAAESLEAAGFDDLAEGAPHSEAGSASLTVNWRSRPESELHWKDYQTKAYDELRALAEAGDGHAATWLAYRLGNCSNQPPPQTSTEIDAAIAEMRRTHLVPIYRDGVVDRMMDFNNSLESLDGQIERYEKSARRCSTFSVEQRAEWEDWTTLALSMGGPVVGLMHNNLLEMMDRDAYAQLIRDLWDAGDPTALYSLSDIHHRASWQDHDPSAEVWGYAYDLAILTLTRNYYEEFEIPVNKNTLAAMEDNLAGPQSRMRARDVREAERLAEEIIEQNENCCLTWPDFLVDSE